MPLTSKFIPQGVHNISNKELLEFTHKSEDKNQSGFHIRSSVHSLLLKKVAQSKLYLRFSNPHEAKQGNEPSTFNQSILKLSFVYCISHPNKLSLRPTRFKQLVWLTAPESVWVILLAIQHFISVEWPKRRLALPWIYWISWINDAEFQLEVNLTVSFLTSSIASPGP